MSLHCLLSHSFTGNLTVRCLGYSPSFAERAGIKGGTGQGLIGYTPKEDKMAKEKKATKKKAASTASNRKTRSKPVVPGASDPDILTEETAADDLPDVAAEDVMATVLRGVGVTEADGNDDLLTATDIQLDPEEYPGAPTIWMLTFLSKDPLSVVRQDRRRIAVLSSGPSGTRPEDLRLSANSTTNTVRVMWRRPDESREADHLLGSIADEDDDLAKALNVFLRKMPDGWLVFDLEVPFQMEGFCRRYPGLQIAVNAYQQERRWESLPLVSKNGLEYQSQWHLITAFEVAVDNDSDRVRQKDNYYVENMASPDRQQRRRPTRSRRPSPESSPSPVKRSKSKKKSSKKKSSKKESAKKQSKKKQYREMPSLPIQEEIRRF